MRTVLRSGTLLLVSMLFAALGLASPAGAQEPPPPAGPGSPEAAQQPEGSPPPPEPAAAPTVEDLQRQIAELKALLAEQQKLIEEQKQRIAAQEGDLKEQSRRLEELLRQMESTTRRLDELQDELPAASADQKEIEERLRRVEEAAKKPPELPPDVVSAGDFPGSIRIPGTDAAVKFGGRVRVAVVATLDPLGSGDRFVSSSIPVGQPPEAGEGKQTNINANTSRFNFELRTPTGAGQMRAFIEGDFFGSGNSFRLRHAYGQFRGFLGGQTWSTFSDPAADHQDLDFEGVSSENVVRQPQLRYTWTLRPDLNIATAIETPEVSVTGGSGSDVVPDLVGRVVWRFKEIGHLQGSAVVREIRAAPDADPEEFQRGVGWGASLSGVIPFRHWNLTDRFIFQLTGGRSIGRYINDLSSLGGQDGVFDPANNDLHLLPMWGWYLDYEHIWKEWARAKDMNLRSSVIWSVVSVDNPDFQPDDAYHLTHRLSVNAIFSPMQRMDAGLQYIWGSRENKNGDSASARQVQLVVLFRF